MIPYNPNKMAEENLLKKLEFNALKEGEYAKPTARSMDSFDGECFSAQSAGSPNRQDYLSDAAPEAATLSPKSFGPFRASRSVGGPARAPSPPNGIAQLEQILSSAYKTPVSITRVRDLRVTKKEVKEVFFSMNHGISKVWVFKADPEKTTRELTAYQIIHEQGVPTGRPIGFEAKKDQDKYPFDVAILGGVVEHAGDPYNQLLQNMELTPQLIFDASVNIVKKIADYQVRLTLAQDEFKKYGFKIENARPRKEIKDRLLLALGINEGKAEGLIKACEVLSRRQSKIKVVSHEDIHTGNIVTINKVDPRTGLPVTSYEEFGFIDWESVSLSNPFSDVVDFHIHHERQALKVCGSYDFSFASIESAYRSHFDSLARKAGLTERVSDNDSLIQRALWNLYEMYDPVRTDKTDIKEKAKTHAAQLWSVLTELANKGYPETEMIKRNLKDLLKKESYLKEVLK